ncbi:hypothetical protein KGD87_24005 [Myxococcus sp. SDU36]|nr:hypothetical protein KGD87_24005 [Myxococcus sp. SDU36]
MHAAHRWSLPGLADWPTLILATQRFVDAVQRLELDGVTFRQVAVR